MRPGLPCKTSSASRFDAGARVQGRDERRQPGPRLRVQGPAQRRGGPCPAGVHRRQLDRRAPAGAARLRAASRGAPGTRERANRGLREPGVVLRREAGGRRGDHRGRVPSETRDRPPVGLQVRRVRQPRRRGALRARRGESHARVPRGDALPVGRVPSELRARVPRHAPGARRDGLHQRRADGPVRAHPRRGPRGPSSCSPATVRES